MLVERRFPLDLHPRIQRVRDLYEQAKRSKWDPERTIPWAKFDPERYSEQDRCAARWWWSASVWGEFGRVAETPALLIRFCLERGGESDAKLFLATRGSQEVVYIEACTRFARLLGGFVDSPPEGADEGAFRQQLYRDALDAEVRPAAYIGAQCAVRDGIVLEHLRESLRGASDPVAVEILTRAVKDKEAQASFGWLYLEEASAGWSDEERDQVAREIEHMLAADSPVKHAALESGLRRHCDMAGGYVPTEGARSLGVPDLERLHAITRRFVGDTRLRLRGLGVDLAEVLCARLGRL